MEDYSIIDLNEDEWLLYKDIRLESLKNDPQAFGSNLEKEKMYTEEKWRSRLIPYSDSNKQLHSFVKHNETNKVVGVVGSYSPENGKAVIVSVYVNRGHRGNGLASRLMEDILDQISKKNSFTIIELSVNKDQKAALNLYKKFGFEIIKEEENILGDGKKHTQCVMQRYV